MINFYLNSDKLKAISATASAKKIRVNRIYDLDFPNEFLSEPDADKLNVKLTEAMLNIIRAGDIKTHSAGFVVDDSKISFREMILPQGKPLQLAPIIKSELFNDPRQAERNTVDYVDGVKLTGFFALETLYTTHFTVFDNGSFVSGSVGTESHGTFSVCGNFRKKFLGTYFGTHAASGTFCVVYVG